MSDLITMMSAAAGAGGEEADPNFNQTVLLLHGDGTNGAQNNTFLDSSTNNFTITRNGNTTQGTFSPFSAPDGRWSNFFDGTNDRLTVADNAALRPGTGNFTIEAWVYRAAAGAAHTIFAKGASTPTGFAFGITSSNTLRFTDTSTDIDSTGTVSANAWNHVAVVREGTGTNQVKLYINGVQDGQGTVSTDFNQTEEARIGENRGATDDFNGYISNFRYVVGSAIYTTAFTPSTSPLTTTSQGAVSSEVELLTCQSNRFVDNSTNGFTVTPVNNVKVTPFSPFAPSAAYSTSVNGGSGYFDGSGDYLDSTTSQVIPTGNFTIEAFVYVTNTDATQTIVAQGTGSGDAGRVFMGIESSSGAKWTVQVGGTQAISSVVPVLNTWHYVAMVYNGSTIKMYLNGTEIASANSSTNASNTTVRIGSNWGGYDFFGYISSVKISDTAKTISSIPTTPFTDDANTELLLNFTNAGIFDNTGKNNLETVGNAQIDTTTKKYGTGSMEFDGTGDYLKGRVTSFIDFGSGNFTIECWVNLSANNQFNPIVLLGRDTQSGLYCDISSSNNARIVAYIGGVWGIVATGSTALSTSTWYHLAFVRNGSSFKIYVDGNEDASATDSGTISNPTSDASASFQVAYLQTSAAVDRYFNGYIDDLRITKGVARYTAAFTPPTKAFPDL